MRILYRFWLWLTKPAMLVAWLGSDAKPVPRHVAVQRMEMCRTCPNSVPGGKAADKIAVAVRKLAQMKGRLGLTLPGETENFCKGCGCKISSKIWVGYAHIKAYQRQSEADRIRAVKPDCWQL
jgi:hypothetical protein